MKISVPEFLTNKLQGTVVPQNAIILKLVKKIPLNSDRQICVAIADKCLSQASVLSQMKPMHTVALYPF
jgi:hypothetical protein